MPVPPIRIRQVNAVPVRSDGRYVLYWMTAFRRMRHNFALERAAAWAEELRRPLLVLEALRVGYPFASDRLHRFVLDGMRENRAAAAKAGVRYHPYVEPAPGAGRGLLEALVERAAVVVTDDFPAFFLPRMVAAAGEKLSVRLEAVDANGLWPLEASEKAAPSAYVFRRWLQRELPAHLEARPKKDPLAGLEKLGRAVVPRTVLSRWPAQTPELSSLPIDHEVGVVADRPGGATEARRRLKRFVRRVLPRYADDRNHPDANATSGLSPYLHFGHLSTYEVLDEVARAEGWSLDRLSPRADGKRRGWWGVSESTEAFLDQVVTWRELGYHFCHHRPDDHASYASLPEWARTTLEDHASDPRPHDYELDSLERADTHDEIWNAAQTELRQSGRVHNYLRMLWGKRILEWSPDPETALRWMVHLNDRYALDGRDPNSYSGITWVLGRFDRPWGPERPVFGTVRYMSSENTRRKLRLGDYLHIFASENIAGSGPHSAKER